MRTGKLMDHNNSSKQQQQQPQRKSPTEKLDSDIDKIIRWRI
jgi:hypothetical protein